MKSGHMAAFVWLYIKAFHDAIISFRRSDIFKWSISFHVRRKMMQIYTAVIFFRTESWFSFSFSCCSTQTIHKLNLFRYLNVSSTFSIYSYFLTISMVLLQLNKCPGIVSLPFRLIWLSFNHFQLFGHLCALFEVY